MNNIINSINNPLIKQIIRLNNDQKYAKKIKLFCIEKYKLVHEAIINNIDIKYMLITLDEYKKYQKELSQYLLINKNCKLIYIDISIAKKISTNISFNQIYAICKYVNNDDINIDKNKNILLLDNIQDPGNLGTIIRTGLGLGIDVIYLNNCVYKYNNKCIKSAMGSIFNKNIIEIEEPISLIQKYIKYNYQIIATVLSNDSYDLNTYKFSKNNNFIIIGNEGHGINPELINLSNLKIKLNMSNNIESLNVAIFCAIICFKILK